MTVKPFEFIEHLMHWDQLQTNDPQLPHPSVITQAKSESQMTTW